MKRWLRAWKRAAGQVRFEARVLLRAYRDPRVPWYARLYAAFVVGYIFSPIDPIPDFIPLLGYLDELLLLPLFILIARRLIPQEVLEEQRRLASECGGESTPRNWVVAGLIVAGWVLLAGSAALLTLPWL